MPSVDRDDVPIDHVYWRDEALRVGSLFGAATAFPQGQGVWREGVILWYG